MGQLENLPTEILLDIFGLFPTQYEKRPDLFNLSLVNRRLNEIANSLLYSAVTLEYQHVQDFNISTQIASKNQYHKMNHIRKITILEIETSSTVEDDRSRQEHDLARSNNVASFIGNLEKDQLHSIDADSIGLLQSIDWSSQTSITSVDFQVPDHITDESASLLQQQINISCPNLRSLHASKIREDLLPILQQFMSISGPSLEHVELLFDPDCLVETSTNLDSGARIIALLSSEHSEECESTKWAMVRPKYGRLKSLLIKNLSRPHYLTVLFPYIEDLTTVQSLMLVELEPLLTFTAMYLPKMTNITSITLWTSTNNIEEIERFLENCSPLKVLLLLLSNLKAPRYPASRFIKRHERLRKLALIFEDGSNRLLYLNNSDPYLNLHDLKYFEELEELMFVVEISEMINIPLMKNLRLVHFFGFKITREITTMFIIEDSLSKKPRFSQLEVAIHCGEEDDLHAQNLPEHSVVLRPDSHNKFHINLMGMTLATDLDSIHPGQSLMFELVHGGMEFDIPAASKDFRLSLDTEKKPVIDEIGDYDEVESWLKVKQMGDLFLITYHNLENS
ncbi:hypothetical protein H072_7787 [Dactylellina haptotyla CBS 200.50]|uniref:F-box domain-containing protein n=1 Tax=Dactylellina haptotyla (strain CBS 200.50) TaxID=1284197 RepID=S8BGQ1_DACHA|nr:hypothetical protein H072_7787 [Dactylellina haptotyla CBS 200.50]